MLEHRRQPLLPRRAFMLRILRYGLSALGLIFASLGMGVLGYHETEGLSWIDALLNASMILGGMGPVDKLHTTSGKIFASLYALFSGVVFIAAVGVMFAPIIHRLFHRFHIELDAHK